MLTTYLAMQNAVLANNMAVSGMMSSSNRMLNTVTANNSQPLRPSFAAASFHDELNVKAGETKVTVAQKLAESLQKALGKDIKQSTPKYGGLDYKA